VTEQAEVLVVGGGQAGLTAGYYLTQAKIPFVILHAGSRVGDSWRARWDSLTLSHRNSSSTNSAALTRLASTRPHHQHRGSSGSTGGRR
jgi:cation diffusion facilitator CzcD-associated flavoprotein CzcO